MTFGTSLLLWSWGTHRDHREIRVWNRLTTAMSVLMLTVLRFVIPTFINAQVNGLWRALRESFLNNANVMQYVDLTCATLAPLRFQLSQKVGKVCRDHDQAAWRQRLGLGHVHAEASREHLGCPAGHIQTLGGCKMAPKWLVFGMVSWVGFTRFYHSTTVFNSNIPAC